MATDFARPENATPIRLIAGRAHYDEVIATIAEARQSVWIATANLKDLMIEDHRARPGQRRTSRSSRARGSYRSILDLFDDLFDRGVDLRILHAAEPSSAFTARLAGKPRFAPRFAGVPAVSGLAGPSVKSHGGSFEMRQCPRVHFKAVVVDGRFVYIGSANFTGAGLGAKGEGKRNFEIGLVSRDDLLLDEVQSLFDEVWRGDPCASCKLRDLCPAPLDGSRPRSPGTAAAPAKVGVTKSATTKFAPARARRGRRTRFPAGPR